MKLTDDQRDALTEIANIGVGRAAAALSELAQARVVLRVPTVTLHTMRTCEEFDDSEPMAIVRQNFYGDLIGQAALVLHQQGAQTLAGLLTEQSVSEGAKIDAECVGTLSEVGNILLNAVLGSMAEMVLGPLSYEIPVFNQTTVQEVIRDFTMSTFDPEHAQVLEVAANFEVAGRNIAGMILVFCEFNALERLLDTALSVN